MPQDDTMGGMTATDAHRMLRMFVRMRHGKPSGKIIQRRRTAATCHPVRQLLSLSVLRSRAQR